MWRGVGVWASCATRVGVVGVSRGRRRRVTSTRCMLWFTHSSRTSAVPHHREVLAKFGWTVFFIAFTLI